MATGDLEDGGLVYPRSSPRIQRWERFRFQFLVKKWAWSQRVTALLLCAEWVESATEYSLRKAIRESRMIVEGERRTQ